MPNQRDYSDDVGLHDWQTAASVQAPSAMLDGVGPKKGISIIPMAGGRCIDPNEQCDADYHRNAHDF
jgi:hypothetical protein